VLRRLATAFVFVLAATACGGSSSTPQGATPASVAVQQSDLPSGMVRCDLTGDIDNFIRAEASPDPSTSKTMSGDWHTAKSKGAKAAYVAVYTDSSAHCSAIKTSGSDIGAATYMLVINFVVQFKDDKTAASSYTSDSVLGFSASSLKAGGAPVIEGANTGLTKNSIALTQPIGGQLYYIAFWQNQAYVVILAVLNLDAASAKKVSTSENGRVR
jgi:hypothetical protein